MPEWKDSVCSHALKRGADPSSPISTSSCCVSLHFCTTVSGHNRMRCCRGPDCQRCSKSSYNLNLRTPTSVLERNFWIVDKQKTWAELSAWTPLPKVISMQSVPFLKGTFLQIVGRLRILNMSSRCPTQTEMKSLVYSRASLFFNVCSLAAC